MKRIVAQLRREDGFTLSEVVVSLLMITVGLMSLAGVMGTVLNRQTIARSMDTMRYLANDSLESMKNGSYDELTSGDEDFGEITDFPGYRRVITVTPDENDTLKVVEVTLTNARGQQLAYDTVFVR